MALGARLVHLRLQILAIGGEKRKSLRRARTGRLLVSSALRAHAPRRIATFACRNG